LANDREYSAKGMFQPNQPFNIQK